MSEGSSETEQTALTGGCAVFLRNLEIEKLKLFSAPRGRHTDPFTFRHARFAAAGIAAKTYTKR